MNSPSHTLSRLIHRQGNDYFKLLNDIEIEAFYPKILEHIKECKHPICLDAKEQMAKIFIAEELKPLHG